MKRGFTLVELSIVLVIVGLLIGGILAAQSMVNTANSQSVIKDISQVKILTQNFMTSYKCAPGDCPSTLIANTYSGSGDGIVTYDEGNLFYPQLVAMGFLTTADDVSTCRASGWAGAPLKCFLKGRLQYSVMTVNGYQSSACNGSTCDTGYGPSLNDASTDPNDNFVMYGHNQGMGLGQNFAKPQGLFKPSEAMAIDKKIDDSLPNAGKVLAYVKYPNNMGAPTGYSAECITPYDYSNVAAKYKLSEKTLACGMAFFLRNGNDVDSNY